MGNIIPFDLPDAGSARILQPCHRLACGAGLEGRPKHMDSVFEELVAIDSKRAFNFFLASLKETALTERLKDDEMFYVASVLAHYSQTPRFDATSMPCMANLSEVFDNFVLQTTRLTDSEILEFGGSQVLLFAGFFRDQMRRRHNVEWYDQVGQSLY